MKLPFAVASIAIVLTSASASWATCRPTSWLTINGGEVYDKNTNLTWARCSVGQRWQDGAGCIGAVKTFTFAEAQKQANGAWRVPTRDELESLIDQSCSPAKINDQAFPEMDPTMLAYWSSTPNTRDDSLAYFVNFYDGTVDNGGYYREGMGAVRLVRSGG
jgi:hypothetical protein